MLPAQKVLSVVALACLSASSFATTTYTSSASFLSSLAPGFYTETFDGIDSPSSPAPFSSGAFSYSVSSAGDLYASGEFLGTSLPNESLTFTFTSGNVTAVGGNFYVTNFSDAFQAVSVTLTLSDATTVSFTPISAADSFRGFTSGVTISSLVMSAPGISLYAGVDNLTVGALPVPEPASWLLMGLGVAGLLVARRRSI